MKEGNILLLFSYIIKVNYQKPYMSDIILP